MTKQITNVVLAVVLAVAAAQAGVTVTNVVAQQRLPWNGVVNIDYEVLGDDPDEDVLISLLGFDSALKVSIAINALTGEGANGLPVKPGVRHMEWDAKVDRPAGHDGSGFSITMHAFPVSELYLVIDLSGGPTAASYPVRYSAASPDLNNNTCRTTELWLRLIRPGIFMMGSPGGELGRDVYYHRNEDQHQVTVSSAFYMGVFEVTQKQWQLVMGTTPSRYKGDMRPVEQVAYSMIRGAVGGSKWPASNQVSASSFFGVLRAKTALLADLPTEAQWEYACRADTTTALGSGRNLTDSYECPNMTLVGRYCCNIGDGRSGYIQHAIVGMYRPNAWGLYDMHGNVYEWCLDWYVSNLGTAAAVDPGGPASGSNRILRGGSFLSNAYYCRSAFRYSYGSPGYGYNYGGFRVCVLPSSVE